MVSILMAGCRRPKDWNQSHLEDMRAKQASPYCIRESDREGLNVTLSKLVVHAHSTVSDGQNSNLMLSSFTRTISRMKMEPQKMNASLLYHHRALYSKTSEKILIKLWVLLKKSTFIHASLCFVCTDTVFSNATSIFGGLESDKIVTVTRQNEKPEFVLSCQHYRYIYIIFFNCIKCKWNFYLLTRNIFWLNYISKSREILQV